MARAQQLRADLTTYADYIPDVEAENPLPEPVAASPNTNVVQARAHTAHRSRFRATTGHLLVR